MNLAKILQMSGLVIGGAGVMLLGQSDAAQAINFVTNPATGNQYGITDAASTWTDAQAAAQAVGGNLVAINDAQEQQWLVDEFGDSILYWIGLTDKDQEGTFEWINGDPFIYSNWFQGEPNNLGNGAEGEDYVLMNWPNFANAGKWGDMANGGYLGPTFGIVERAAPVPTPALLPGLLGFGMNLVRKKRKQEAVA